ncbi:DUF350 domain-containing protein [Bacillus sp. HMF5848]|uniref:DUF350 domain-containing protein n=1 Tax=Bacillus sp. HMF5848 TaxID=2495421 RepID=UPI000F799435|nr:DUF350 domain-containing protein [Bacillus sp. HMF5848]RSK27167.1 DUF350 domain-containing protein [Bacillus sp. HMF5848]
MSLFISFLAYFAVGIALLFIGLWLFEITTKTQEFKLIGTGNKAAAYVLGGRLLGLAIVLYSSIYNSISLLDMVIWGSVAIVTQIFAFYLAELLTPKFNIHESIEEDNQAVGIFLLMLSISIGLVIAGCLTY